MRVLERQLKAYNHEHGALPPDMDGLLRFSPDLENCLTNTWGMPVSYHAIDASNAVLTTTCYGDIDFVRRINFAEQAR
jgi:hypothetical protein